MSRTNADTLCAVERIAEQFTGLPNDVRRLQIIDALKDVGSRLGFNRTQIRYLELMVAFSKEQDWRRGRGNCKPFTYLGVTNIARRLSISRQQVNRIEKALVSLHAICLKDSGNYHPRQA